MSKHDDKFSSFELSLLAEIADANAKKQELKELVCRYLLSQQKPVNRIDKNACALDILRWMDHNDSGNNMYLFTIVGKTYIVHFSESERLYIVQKDAQ